MEFRAPIRRRGGNQEALLQIKSCVENTFGSYAPKVFDNLPQEVRKCEQYKVFIKKLTRQWLEVYYNSYYLNLEFFFSSS